MRLKVISLAAFIVFCAVTWVHYKWIEWAGTAEKPLQMWSTRDQAYLASAGAADGRPIGNLAKGERVDVLWDRYGKDYWACYVKTLSGQRGWVLCTDLEMD
jgi:hypothetical protein